MVAAVITVMVVVAAVVVEIVIVVVVVRGKMKISGMKKEGRDVPRGIPPDNEVVNLRPM